jgi:hypothetical protein
MNNTTAINQNTIPTEIKPEVTPNTITTPKNETPLVPKTEVNANTKTETNNTPKVENTDKKEDYIPDEKMEIIQDFLSETVGELKRKFNQYGINESEIMGPLSKYIDSNPKDGVILTKKLYNAIQTLHNKIEENKMMQKPVEIKPTPMNELVKEPELVVSNSGKENSDITALLKRTNNLSFNQEWQKMTKTKNIF